MLTDREQICQLVHRYCDSVCRYDATMWTATWAPNATWHLGSGRDFAGRDQIVEFWHKAMSALHIVVQMANNSTITVNPDGKTASGRWYINEHVHRKSGEKHILLGWYDDTYVKLDGEWVFASRALVKLYGGPADLSAEFTPAQGSGWG